MSSPLTKLFSLFINYSFARGVHTLKCTVLICLNVLQNSSEKGPFLSLCQMSADPILFLTWFILCFVWKRHTESYLRLNPCFKCPALAKLYCILYAFWAISTLPRYPLWMFSFTVLFCTVHTELNLEVISLNGKLFLEWDTIVDQLSTVHYMYVE